MLPKPDRKRYCVQVTNQLGVLPRHEVQVPPGEVNEESEVNARCAPPAVLPRVTAEIGGRVGAGCGGCTARRMRRAWLRRGRKPSRAEAV